MSTLPISGRVETLTRRTNRQYLGQTLYEIVGSVALLLEHRYSCLETDQRSPPMVIWRSHAHKT